MSTQSASTFFFDPERREAMIREAAYLRAKSRGFFPGAELEDWLAAETQIDQILTDSKMPILCRNGAGH